MKRIIFLLGIALILLSCGKKAVVRQYYVIEIPAAVDSATVPRTPLHEGYCELLPVRIAPAYAQKRIAVRTETHQLNYYFEHEWAVRPEEAFTIQIENYLQSRKLFATVTSRLSRTLPQYELHTRIHRLEAIQEKKILSAHLHLEWELFHSKSGQRVVYYSFDRSHPLNKKTVNLLAAAISEILEEELQIFSGKIEDYLLQTRENTSAAPQDEELKKK